MLNGAHFRSNLPRLRLRLGIPVALSSPPFVNKGALNSDCSGGCDFRLLRKKPKAEPQSPCQQRERGEAKQWLYRCPDCEGARDPEEQDDHLVANRAANREDVEHAASEGAALAGCAHARDSIGGDN